MDRIDLPRIDAHAHLTDAIEAMRNSMRSGVVVDLPDEPLVLDVDVVLHALRHEGDVEAASVKPRVTCLRLPGDRAADDVVWTEDSRFEVEEMMDGSGAGYALARVIGDTAELVTRHENWRWLLDQTPSVWRCRNQPAHYWQAPDLLPGNRCRVDGTVVDLMF